MNNGTRIESSLIQSVNIQVIKNSDDRLVRVRSHNMFTDRIGWHKSPVTK